MFENLAEYLPVPDNPDDNGNDFSEVENELSVMLPNDYKQFVATYGTGWIGDVVLIYNPFSSIEAFNLLIQIKKLKAYKNVLPDIFPIYPEENGLLPLGYIQDNGRIFWHTKSDNPNDWAIVLTQVRSRHFEEYKMTLSKFLLNLVTSSENSILKSSKILGVDDFDSSLPFVPHSIAM